MDDVKFIQIAMVPQEFGKPILYVLDSAGVIWHLANENAKDTDENGGWPAAITIKAWHPLPAHPANSAKRRG